MLPFVDENGGMLIKRALRLDIDFRNTTQYVKKELNMGPCVGTR
jgi:hypothetical protein